MCELWEQNVEDWVIVDNLGVPSLLRPYSEWMPINYCPWCGAKLPDNEHE